MMYSSRQRGATCTATSVFHSPAVGPVAVSTQFSHGAVLEPRRQESPVPRTRSAHSCRLSFWKLLGLLLQFQWMQSYVKLPPVVSNTMGMCRAGSLLSCKWAGSAGKWMILSGWLNRKWMVNVINNQQRFPWFPSLVLQFGNVCTVCVCWIAKHVLPRVVFFF